MNIFALNAYMQEKSIPPQKPLVTYPALVGKILAQQREARGIKQGDLAATLGLSQSAYSRLESGDSVLNLSQLRNAATQLGLQPGQVLQWADQYEARLRQQGVDVISEKPDNPAAIAIGLGLLAALLMSAR
ncbi:helix-turn-helix transcriptional regulator [Hydrogenophaga sp.]|uniref:helix-turn-helix domain-containing protein n=1 Tax=Hydrogenophaga sp. TaxID=1904254 RepID=UPI0025C16698|nr:helix-turn-helix transcriptional regulator [Hydrogenophaga sp.]